MPTSPLTSVLLVDDDPTVSYLNQLLLTRTMHVTEQVLVAENGQQALDLLTQVCPVPASPICPPLILLDLNMPIMNGPQFLQAYAQLPAAQRQQSVVVILSTSLLERDHLLAQQLPIADFVEKPLTRAKMEQLLARHFSVAEA